MKLEQTIVSMKTIKIFIASSSELKEDRDEFRMFISRENDRLHTSNIYLEVVQWENFLDAISDTRIQDEYNKAISECDIVLCLFFTKVGRYSAEEFDTAYQVFKDKGKPKIWTYFKDAEIKTGSITEQINTLIDFKKKIGSLGHFYTQYTNIDNLINKFRSQLDKFLPQFRGINSTDDNEKPSSVKDIQKPIENIFNKDLTKILIGAIGSYNHKAKDFVLHNSDWENNPNLVPTAKRIIISSYVGVLGVQLRKLMSIGEEDFSTGKMKRYLENCQLTTKRGLQLLCYALISKLWDHQLEHNRKFSRAQTDAITKFFKNVTEEQISGYADLLRILITAFSENNLELPIPHLNTLKSNLGAESPFQEACTQLDSVTELLNNSSFSERDCKDAELNLARILKHLSFLAEYRMISIKDINYDQQRNDGEGLYLHNYTLLEGDNQANNHNQSKIRKENTPVISYAVLLFKNNYRENINMVPFIIDYNGLADTGGSKICFYAYCDTYDDLDLNYSFIEDSSKVVIRKSGNPKPDENNVRALNSWLAKKENRKDMNLDNVYDLFHEAKKTLTGIESKMSDDLF